jgi:hypothetical protein
VSAEPLFDRVCEALEKSTQLDRLSARGTVRLALKSAGLDSATVTPKQFSVVIARVMADELRSRGVADPEPVCRALERALGDAPVSSAPAQASPEDMFRRLRGY